MKACDITDHDLLFVTLPMGTASPHTPEKPGIQVDATKDTANAERGKEQGNTSYRWIEGNCLKEYGNSAAKWK
jgi:hypothetical protein